MPNASEQDSPPVRVPAVEASPSATSGVEPPAAAVEARSTSDTPPATETANVEPAAASSDTPPAGETTGIEQSAAAAAAGVVAGAAAAGTGGARIILLRATPWPERTLPLEGQSEPFTARFPSRAETTAIVAEMKIYHMNLSVESFNLTGTIPVTDECEKWLDFTARRDYSEPPRPILDLHNELMDAIESLNNTTTITAPFAGGYSIGGFRTFFSSGTQWFPYQVPAPSWLGPGTKIQPYSYLPNAYGSVVQRHITKRLQPLEGFSSLNHRSRAPKHEWIECAVAAELAIKDFISRHNAVAAAILERVQSPPVHEMYGRVLKQIIKEESPVAKELNWGATVRNHLVHRVGSPSPTNRQVFMYKYIIELALYHLMKHLYPDVEEIDFEYNDRLTHLNQGRSNKKDDDPKRPNYYLAWRKSLREMYDIG